MTENQPDHHDNSMPCAKRPRNDLLPVSLPPLGIPLEQAAAYIGVSPSKFLDLVTAGLMPKPKRIGRRVIWCVAKLNEAFGRLPDGEDYNEWDEITPCASSLKMGQG